MAFIQAFTGGIGGSFADQWKDFYTVPHGLEAGVATCAAVRSGANRDRSSNDEGSSGVITNGSLILVPEGFALITLENGRITGYVDQPGGYQWSSGDVNSQSFFAGGTFSDSVVRQSWERFKFGGAPATSQVALFVNLKEIPNNRFGTQSQIYWDDAYLNTQVGAIARGTCTLRIADPILFVRNFLPAAFYSVPARRFDMHDFGNDAATQLFTELVGSLAAAFSLYTNDPAKRNRITSIQGDSVGFAQSLAAAVENAYRWRQDRGIEIVNASIMGIDYDEDTKQLISKVKQADALMGARGNANLQASFAEGLQAAGANPDGGALGMGFMGMGMQYAGGAVGAMQQPAPGYIPAPGAGAAAGYAPAPGYGAVQPVPQAAPAQAAPAEDPYERLTKLKGLCDAGVISQAEFDAAKAKLLGL